MEEFDRHIKSKIESLTEVPGVKFNEKRVWRRIRSNWGSDLTPLTVAIVLLISAVVVFHSLNEDQSEHIASGISRESKSDVSVDPDSVVISEEAIPKENDSMKETFTITEGEEHVAKASIDDVNRPSSSISSSSLKEVKDDSDQSISSDESSPQEKTPIVNREPPIVNNVHKELAITSGKESQTVGITHLKGLDNRFSLSYGIQFNRSWSRRFNHIEGQNKPFEFYRIQIPIGLRYDLRQKNGLLNPFLYTGLINNFFLKPNSKNMNYNLRFESELGLDIRIFSTEDGKKGHLRFKYPLYNKSIINQGIQRPSLYDVLKQ